jgi:hypothetical protein
MRVLILALLLVGCAKPDTGLGVAVQVPPLPAQLNEKARPLPANNDTSMGGQVLDNTRNIRAYNQVGFKYNRLLEYYECVRKAVNQRKKPKCQ